MAFFPLDFLAGVGLGSFCAAMRAAVRARAALRRSGLYPRLAVLEAIPTARREPDRERMEVVAEAEDTAYGEAFVLRVVI